MYDRWTEQLPGLLRAPYLARLAAPDWRVAPAPAAVPERVETMQEKQRTERQRLRAERAADRRRRREEAAA